MKYFTLFAYSSEGQPHIIMANEDETALRGKPVEYTEAFVLNRHKNLESMTDCPAMYFLENSNHQMWERHDENVGGWIPTNRQKKMINRIINENPKIILQFVPACSKEEHSSFKPGKVPMEPRTVENLWSHNEYFGTAK